MSSSSVIISLKNCIDTILVPQGVEYQAVCRGFRDKNQALLNIIPIPTGISPLNNYLEQWQQTKEFVTHPPKAILLMGLGGSLSPNYRVGEAILYQECCLLQDDILAQKWQTCDTKLSILVYHHFKNKMVRGKGLTSDRIITLAQEKQLLGERYQADVVDMEGIAVLEFGKTLNIPVTMIRVVSDNCQQNLPDLTLALETDGTLNPWKLSYQMLKSPLNSLHLIQSSLKALARLQQLSQELSTFF